MNRRTENGAVSSCREARRRFRDFDDEFTHRANRATASLRVTERVAVERHLAGCDRCRKEFRLFSMSRAALDAAASPEPVAPSDEFFVQLRAKIARGPAEIPTPAPAATNDSWAGVIALTARQLIPVLALVLLIIAGATFIWREPTLDSYPLAARPGDRVVFNDVLDYPEPTPDDVLETLVAVEDKYDGK